MTAIILAQKLLLSAGEFKGPYDNPLYNTWVKRISLAELQTTQKDEPALDSLFSSDLIETISRETLLARYSAMPPAAAQKHAGAGDSIRVGVAVTNLNGVAYGYPVAPSGKFTYIDYADQFTRNAEAPACDNADFWEPLRQAAVACGAFPIAFRPQDVQRSAKGEPDDYAAENLEPWPHDPATFTYSDGGILQNQPLGIAKNLVDMIDCHQNQEQALLPFCLAACEAIRMPMTIFMEANADYVHMIKRLIGVVMGQSGFQDWITALGVNKRIALLDTRARGLKDAIIQGEIDVPALSTTSNSLLRLFFPDGAHMPPGATVPETLGEGQFRIAAQYASENERI